MTHPIIKHVYRPETRRGLQEKVCDLGHEKGLMTLYKLIFKLKRSDSALGLDLVSQVCPHRADLEHKIYG